MKIGEDSLIERIRRRIPSAERGLLRLGIGDDAAVLRPAPGTELVVTCDMFLEDVHFLADAYPAEAVGYKALARATSDIPAMGARPELFLLSLSLPEDRSGRWFDGMLSGMARAARQFGLRLAGGDTAQSPKKNPRIGLSITVVGIAEGGRVLRRSGARPGDSIFVSGRLGAAQFGIAELDFARAFHRGALETAARAAVLPATCTGAGPMAGAARGRFGGDGHFRRAVDRFAPAVQGERRRGQN